MLLPLALPALLLACQTQTPCSTLAMTNRVSSYPYGEQLSMDLTPDRTLAFVAEGAVITFLDMPAPPWTTAPAVIEKFPVPEMQPLALRYLQVPTLTQQDWLFIAGGSQGLWALPLCPNLIQNHGICGGYSPILVDTIEGGYFERKRCLAVAIDEHSTVLGGSPVLYALFSASSDPTESGIGRTELRAYNINGTTFPLLAALEVPVATTVQRAQKGTALAIDTNEHDAVYVAMGKGGIWKAVLSGGGPFSLTTTSTPMWLPATIDSVRDMSIVRATIGTTSRAFLYAALNFGSILEYELTGSHTNNTTDLHLCGPQGVDHCGYPELIAATVNGNNVYVVVALDSDTGKHLDTGAPYTVNGMWKSICLFPGVDDPDAPTLPPSTPRKLLFFSRDLSSTTTLARALEQDLPPVNLSSWNALILPSTFSGSTFPSYLNTGYYGTQIWSIDTVSWASTLQQTYVGKGLGTTDATVSLMNPGVVRFGLEGAGAVIYDGYLAYIDPQPPYQSYIISGTHDECPNGFPALSCCGNKTNAGAFGGNIMGEAHWLDQGTPVREWFLPGRPSKQRFTDSNCPPPPPCNPPPPGGCLACLTIPDCSTTPWYPCDAQGYYQLNTFWRPGDLPSMHLDTGSWQLIAHTLPASGMPVATTLDPRWEQIALQPISQGSGPTPPEARANTVTYSNSIVDPRMINQYPAALYAARGGTNFGVHAFRPEELTILAQANTLNNCTSFPPAWTGGYGEELLGSTLSSKQIFTHIELERTTAGVVQCVNNSECGGTSRTLYNNRVDIYQTRNGSGNNAYVLAVAAGFPTCKTQATNPCYWLTYYGRPMLVLYDITTTGDGTFGTPELLRVGIGTNPGHAFAVKTKTYGTGSTARTYAFVADITGSLYAFDVTGDKVFPKAPANKPYLPTSKVLLPVSMLVFPNDPYDGLRANCIDLELDGVYLYCALGRAGVGIVDVTDALHPQLCAVLDTPGIVEGLAIRIVGTSPPHKQVIVCDSRCGFEVYQ